MLFVKHWGGLGCCPSRLQYSNPWPTAWRAGSLPLDSLRWTPPNGQDWGGIERESHCSSQWYQHPFRWTFRLLRSFARDIPGLAEHLGRCPVAQGLMGPLVVEEPKIGAQFPAGCGGMGQLPSASARLACSCTLFTPPIHRREHRERRRSWDSTTIQKTSRSLRSLWRKGLWVPVAATAKAC